MLPIPTNLQVWHVRLLLECTSILLQSQQFLLQFLSWRMYFLPYQLSGCNCYGKIRKLCTTIYNTIWLLQCKAKLLQPANKIFLYKIDTSCEVKSTEKLCLNCDSVVRKKQNSYGWQKKEGTLYLRTTKGRVFHFMCICLREIGDLSYN